jgi:hypothetical protein
MLHAWERGKVCRFLMGKHKGKVHLKDQGVNVSVGTKWTFGILVGVVWSGFTWLRIGIVGGLL